MWDFVKRALGLDYPPSAVPFAFGASPPMMDGVPRSPHWPIVRALWLKGHPACAACGGKLDLQVHHKKPYHLYPSLEEDPNNFMTLCENPARNCHHTFGHGYDWTRFVPDVEEVVAAWRKTLSGLKP